MTLAAIQSDDPVLIIENRSLYHGEVQQVNVGGPIQAVGGAAMIRPGRDLTIVSWSAMLFQALEAARQLEQEGIEAEVINARWLNPFDWDAVLSSVRRTGRLLIAHEAVSTGGFGGEIAARVSRDCFGQLRAPVERVATYDSRIPSAPHLQRKLIPDAGRIAACARDMLARC